jgi:Heavy-metal resistance
VIKVLLTAIAAVVFALAGYWTYYRCATMPTQSMLSRSGGEMEWLRHEYHLGDAQFIRIQKLHREYAPACDRMCARIGEANEKLNRLIKANRSFTPEIEAAVDECVEVQAECRRALLRHVYAVGAEMAPEDGTRYVQMMTARIVEPRLTYETVISEPAK